MITNNARYTWNFKYSIVEANAAFKRKEEHKKKKIFISKLDLNLSKELLK
jgi:hypothetical protein